MVDYPDMARIVARSERLVRKWSHPTAEAYPTLMQAVTLDSAYVAAGGDGTPLHEVYSRMLDIELGRQITCQLALSAAIAVAAREFGEAVAASIAVTRPGNPDPRAIYVALSENEEACEAMAVVTRHLTALLPNGAGPIGEAKGEPQ
ncbi:hypothetical protein OMP43_03780 [Sphingomonas sp. CBMAI 2297]|uniref:hypothetical protein n=1 Tax=Sphingomonas sp. CBMAI 2297 TaxID=2991720 RepID=UPI002458AB97|nr:hypothetical protein [Sphingomonas sp. CBMAI 2297]MDH4743135.1 hypothetical protein [Sphingomonas sp. CBMAI 2297]